MDIKELMSGSAVVIDDAFSRETDATGDAFSRETDATGDASGGEERIWQIVNWFETEWCMPFVKRASLPQATLWPNLLRAASFVLLDWKLWGAGGETLKLSAIEEIKGFLTSARENLVPVFILTNENPDDVKTELDSMSDEVYNREATTTNFVFVEHKSNFWTGESVDVGALEGWVYGNASVYALKTWNRVMDGAKSELFQAMCKRSVNWPRVFWNTYQEDNAAPSVSLTNLISHNLQGRMRVDAFEEKHLNDKDGEISLSDLRKLIRETSFRNVDVLPGDEVRCGDLYKMPDQKYLLNLRPDCDCIPRNGNEVGKIEVYCVEGDKITETQLRKKFKFKHGCFDEHIAESIVFSIDGESSIRFNFTKLRVCEYSKIRDKRLGRLLHPYVTRVQQRYASFIQRQGLPRIPKEAVGTCAPGDAECDECCGGER